MFLYETMARVGTIAIPKHDSPYTSPGSPGTVPSHLGNNEYVVGNLTALLVASAQLGAHKGQQGVHGCAIHTGEQDSSLMQGVYVR